MDAQGASEHRRPPRPSRPGPGGRRRQRPRLRPLPASSRAARRGLSRTAPAETAAEAAISIRVVDGTADTLPSPDAGMDAAVASLVLCSVPDQARALAGTPPSATPRWRASLLRAHPSRHLRPGQGPAPRRRHLAHLVGGCHTSRDTLTAITTAGFHLVSTRRFRFPDSRPPSPAAPHVLGIARRPPESRPEGRQRID